MTSGADMDIAVAPPTPSDAGSLWRWRDVALIGAVVALLGLFTPGALNIVNSLESGYSLSVQEMVRDGHWLVPTLNERPRTVKPPLPFWISATVCEVAGAPSAPIGLLRSVSAVMGFLTALCLYGLGGRLFDRRAGLWAALVWASCFLTVMEYRCARHDIFLTAAVALTMTGVWKAWRGERFGWAITAIGAIAAFQCKGPVSWLLTVLPAAGFVLVRRPIRWRFLGGLGLWAVVAGLSLLPWLVFLLTTAGRSRFHELFWEAFGRIASNHATFVWPWFYLAIFGFVLPWTVYLVGGVVIGFEKKFAARRQSMMFCWWWLVGGVVLMSIPFEKTERYAVPLIAPAALLMGQLISYHLDLHRAGRFDRGARPLWYGHILTLVGVSIGVPIAMQKMFLASAPMASAVGLVLSGLTLVVAVALIRRRPDWGAAGSLVFAVVMSFAWTQLHARAPINRDALRRVAPAMMQVIGDHAAITWPTRPPNQLIYYAQRPLPALGEWYQLARAHPDWSSGKLNAVLADPPQFEQAIEPLLDRYFVRHAGRTFYIVTRPNRLEQIGRLAKAHRLTCGVVMDLTTRKPGRWKEQRDPLVLVEVRSAAGPVAGSADAS